MNKCENCGELFLPTQKKPNQKFCSNKCWKEFNKDILRDKKKLNYLKNREKNIEYSRNHRNIIPPIKRRSSKLKYLYGITIEDYNRMFNEQEESCAICGKNQSQLKKKLFVDHDHVTGEVRGLLCESCNFAIGYFYDDVNTIKNSIKYLGGE